tara:strand:+ start:671 stop:916 length:246 start_codon:yes stop_codon:yes gene_type:complete
MNIRLVLVIITIIAQLIYYLIFDKESKFFKKYKIPIILFNVYLILGIFYPPLFIILDMILIPTDVKVTRNFDGSLNYEPVI